jgi:CheY-like chemotaxis protein
VTSDVTFDRACEVDADGAEGADGRALVGAEQVVVAHGDSRRTIPADRVFDAVAASDGTAGVTLGFETDDGRRVLACRFERDDAAEAFLHAVFGAALDGAAVRIRADGHERRGRVEVGRAGFRVSSGDGRLRLRLRRVDEIALDGDGRWIRVSGRHDGARRTFDVAFETAREQNLAGRYLRTLRDGDDGAGDAGRTGEIRVLLVDDDDGFGEMAAHFVPRANERIVVETVTDVESGLARLDRDPRIDCVVSDYRMPGESGLSFLESVRDRFHDVPFLLFTGRGNEQIAAEAIGAGVTDYVMKDTDTAQFVTLAERIERAVTTATAPDASAGESG